MNRIKAKYQSIKSLQYEIDKSLTFYLVNE